MCLGADTLYGADDLGRLRAVCGTESRGPIDVRAQTHQQIGICRHGFHARIPTGVVSDGRKTSEAITELMYPGVRLDDIRWMGRRYQKVAKHSVRVKSDRRNQNIEIPRRNCPDLLRRKLRRHVLRRERLRQLRSKLRNGNDLRQGNCRPGRRRHCGGLRFHINRSHQFHKDPGFNGYDDIRSTLWRSQQLEQRCRGKQQKERVAPAVHGSFDDAVRIDFALLSLCFPKVDNLGRQVI